MKESVAVSIVAFNTPYPPDYGGSIDVFYRIKALYELGVRIYLHCFIYNDFQPQQELSKYCEKVYYYPRTKGFLHFFSRLPYIVSTRSSFDLVSNLKTSGAPVIFEGLHTCSWINHPVLRGIKKIIRMHNIEHRYYSELYKASGNIFRKAFYLNEAFKLKQFEKAVAISAELVAISSADHLYFQSKYGNSYLIPAFHPFNQVTSVTGTGSFFLYHGNLAVEENQKAAIFLIEKVFQNLGIPFVIAGKNPPRKIIRLANNYQNISLKVNPSDTEMINLINNAQGCVLPTFQATGLKLKLLGSLFAGRFCIVNKKMVAGTGLEDLCLVAETPDEFRDIIQKVKLLNFSEDDKRKRESLLLQQYSNKNNAKKILNLITGKVV